MADLESQRTAPLRSTTPTNSTHNTTKLQNHISSTQQLNLVTFVDELIRTPSSSQDAWPTLDRTALLGPLTRSNFPVTSNPDDFIDYLLRQATSVGSGINQDSVALGDVTCACLGLDDHPTFKSRCERLRDVINDRCTYLTGDEPNDGTMQVDVLLQFVTVDLHTTLTTYTQLLATNDTLSFKNFKGRIFLQDV